MRLIEGVNQHLPTFHRYLKLRRRVMKLPDELHYYDLYAPLVVVGGAALHARGGAAARRRPRCVRSAPTTPACSSAASAIAGWTGIPTEGKVSGAYSNGGAYDVHPYILLNYLGQYNDVSTLAHELGHTMHSYYSNQTQPYPTASYTDVRRRGGVHVQRGAARRSHAEDDRRRADAAVAARQLSRRHQVHGVPPDAVRRVRAADARDGEKGQPITGEALCGLYLDIRRRYYGHADGVCIVDDYVAARVELHPALLPRVLRVPVRDVVHAPPRRCRRRCWPATRHARRAI